MKLIIPSATVAATAGTRRPAFVSPSTNGVQVVTYAHSDTNHTTPLATVVTDVSSGSSACTTGGGNRTCTVGVQAPSGVDDFVFTLYDTAPVNGAIPGSAHALGLAGLTQTIMAGTNNVVTANVGGIVVGLSGNPATISTVATGQTQMIALTIAPTDFGNNAITAGTANAPFANPITVAVTESGGSGHVTLELNGGTPATTVTVTKATDTVQAVYDGAGAPGYQASVALTAPATAGEAAASETSVIRPSLFVTNPTVFWTSTTHDIYPAGQLVLAIQEPYATSAPTYTASTSGCGGILKTGTLVANGNNATLLIVGGATTSTSGCSLTIGDGTLTYVTTVQNTTRTDSASHTITEYTTSLNQPFGITTGMDGNLWVSDQASGVAGSGTIAHIQPNGTNETNITLPNFVTPWFDSLGPDGNVWVGDDNSFQVAKITTGGTVTNYTANNMWTNFTTPGLDGKEWFSECNNHYIGDVNTTNGQYTETNITSGESQGITLGPDGNIWFLDFTTSQIEKVVNGSPSVVATASSMPFAITTGPDGNLWITEGANIQKMTPAGTLTAPYAISSGGDARDIVAGPDGNLWFTDLTNGKLGVITTGGSVTEFSIPSSNAEPEGVSVGPDGNIWFAETGTRKIGFAQL